MENYGIIRFKMFNVGNNIVGLEYEMRRLFKVIFGNF